MAPRPRGLGTRWQCTSSHRARNASALCCSHCHHQPTIAQPLHCFVGVAGRDTRPTDNLQLMASWFVLLLRTPSENSFFSISPAPIFTSGCTRGSRVPALALTEHTRQPASSWPPLLVLSCSPPSTKDQCNFEIWKVGSRHYTRSGRRPGLPHDGWRVFVCCPARCNYFIIASFLP